MLSFLSGEQSDLSISCIMSLISLPRERTVKNVLTRIAYGYL